ncbi:hypothetical protein ACFQE8_05980 [Salinirubellus sp. GCM10025818]|uniref:hypothetical protein n=1 Tax=Salinirubellus TaxID=2162630 RepID=UPI0030CD8090
MTRRSRRSVLGACGAGLAALAGCAELDVEIGDDEAEREYDVAPLAAIAEEDPPTRPDSFPVDVTEELVERHYDRAREFVAAVPERPAVPNGVVAERLRDRRERAIEGIDDRPDAATGPSRLGAARRTRSEAAEVNGAYRAAVDEIERESVARSREELRRDLHELAAESDYRGGDPAEALVVHAELEGLRGYARRSAEAWPPFPADPAADVFRVGEIVGSVEEGWAALGDAIRLRARYLDGTDDPRSYRSAMTAAAHRLDRRTATYRRRVGEFLDTRAAEAFDRDVEGTPAAELYEEARRNVEFASDDAGRERRTGDHATATLGAATEMASLRAFRAVIDAIEAGEYGPPEDAERVSTAHREAIAALREAWTTKPVGVSVELAEPAREAVAEAHYRLEDTGGEAYEVDSAFASLVRARLYAEAVPDTVASVVAALESEA